MGDWGRWRIYAAGVLAVLTIVAVPLGIRSRRGPYESAPAGIVGWFMGDRDLYRPRPSARPDPSKVYHMEVWVGLPEMGRSTSDAIVAWVRSRCSPVNRHFARTKTVVRAVPGARLGSELNRRLKSGRPPDVVLFPPGLFMDWGRLQVPLQSFLDEEEQSAILPSALAGVAVDGAVGGWPLGLRVSLWVSTAPGLARHGLDAQSWGEGKVTRAQLIAVGSKDEAPLAVAAPDARFAEDVLPPGDQDDGIRLLVAAAEGHKSIQSTPLSAFLGGKALALAPVSPRLVRFLTAVGGPTLPLVLLPPPGARGPAADVSAVSVFRASGRAFKGHEQVRISVEIARSLAKDATTLCEETLMLPADARQEPPPILRYAALRSSAANCTPPRSFARGDGGRGRASARLVQIVEGIARDGLGYEGATDAIAP